MNPERKRGFAWARAVGLSLLIAVGFASAGCVSQGKAKAQAEAAFKAGEQQAIARMQQSQMQGQVVKINGLVRQAILPWTPQMTVGSALVAADYYGPDPTGIVIVRAGRAVHIDPRELLSGRDVQLLVGDILHIEVGPPQPQPLR